MLRHQVHDLIDRYTLVEVLDRMECILAERLDKTGSPLANEIGKLLEQAIVVAEKIQDAGLLPRENRWD